MNRFKGQDRDRATAAAFLNPMVGDHFTEMLTFHVFVEDVGPDYVTINQGSPPISFPKGGERTTMTREQYAKRFEYDTIPGKYWVSYEETVDDIHDWIDKPAKVVQDMRRPEEKQTVTKIRKEKVNVSGLEQA
jgi:hypothetical protein